MFGAQVGPMEIFIVLAIVLLIFGPKRLPGLGRQLGRGMREFKESITGEDKGRRDDDDDEAPALSRATADEPARATAEPVRGTDGPDTTRA